MPIKSWPADRVERRGIETLIPYASNARTHSDEQVAQIAASMREWGWTNPILIDDAGMIIAGHGRVMAARKLGLKDAPVMVASGWTEAQKKAYVLADNQLALNAGWNAELLVTEIKGLDELGFDLTLLGFGDLGALLRYDEFLPGQESDQGKLDELAPQMVTCPSCATEFNARGE